MPPSESGTLSLATTPGALVRFTFREVCLNWCSWKDSNPQPPRSKRGARYG